MASAETQQLDQARPGVMEAVRALGTRADGETLYRTGLAYSVGTGVEADPVAAHKWFNLAAMRGHEEAKARRQELAELMSEAELRAALKAARQWLRLMN